MFIFAQETGSRKIPAPFLIYLAWKGSWSAQLRAVIGHLYGQLTSSIIWKHTGEQDEAICCYDFEKTCSVFEIMLGFDIDKLWKPGIILVNIKSVECFKSVMLKNLN